jgi:hypothetical protein
MQLYFALMRMEMLLVTEQAIAILSMDLHGTTTLTKQCKLMLVCADRFRKLASRLNSSHQYSFSVDKETQHVLRTYNTCFLACEYAARSIAASDKQFFSIDPMLIPIILEIKPMDDFYSIKGSHLINICKQLVKTATSWEELNHLEDIDRYMVGTKCILSKVTYL